MFSLTGCTEAVLNNLVTNAPYIVDYKGKECQDFFSYLRFPRF